MKKKWLMMLCAAVLALTVTMIAFAAQENELNTPCEHDYQVVSLESNGDIILMCDNCYDRITTTFVEHINERNYAPLDVVPDGIVNAKDYAYIYRNYKNDDWGGEIVPPIL
jgi:hypothetical protein